MLNKSRLITIGLSVVATAVAIGMIRKSASEKIAAGTAKASDTLAGKLGVL